jgi:hypothetical protein
VEDRQAAARRPAGPSAIRQKWRQLLFLHWEVSMDALRPLVPRPLSVDTYEGRAFVGVVPFVVRGAHPRLLPAVPGLSNFNELNVRTYVHLNGREPGVWFFSLDASNLADVLAARATFRLPYCHAEMEVVAKSARPHYRSERRRFGRRPANFEAVARLGDSLGTAEPGTLAYFFVERYLLYTQWTPTRLKVGQVHHQPYPLQQAEVDFLECARLLQADGLPALEHVPAGRPYVLFSPGVDVEVFAPRDPLPSRTGRSET